MKNTKSNIEQLISEKEHEFKNIKKEYDEIHIELANLYSMIMQVELNKKEEIKLDGEIYIVKK